MSGLAAGIRLAHFGQKVCILERHNAPGGLNSFYSFAGRKYDVGLHAMTNYVPPGVKGTPLGKLLRQLRIEREEFALCPQKQSRIAFRDCSLKFTNDFAVLDAEVATRFPAQAGGWRKLVETVRTYDDVSLDAQPLSAREVVGRHITDPLLAELHVALLRAAVIHHRAENHVHQQRVGDVPAHDLARRHRRGVERDIIVGAHRLDELTPAVGLGGKPRGDFGVEHGEIVGELQRAVAEGDARLFLRTQGELLALDAELAE